jgi:hypothetical protein
MSQTQLESTPSKQCSLLRPRKDRKRIFLLWKIPAWLLRWDKAATNLAKLKQSRIREITKERAEFKIHTKLKTWTLSLRLAPKIKIEKSNSELWWWESTKETHILRNVILKRQPCCIRRTKSRKLWRALGICLICREVLVVPTCRALTTLTSTKLNVTKPVT